MKIPRQKVEAISGRVIAYSGVPVCLNGNSYWSMIIRAEPHKKTPESFFQVVFSLPCDKTAKSVLVNPSIQKFHLIRQKNIDSVLEENIDVVNIDDMNKIIPDGKPDLNSRIPAWHYLPGNERFTLPFGNVLPCYYSVEFPYIPVL
jgi:hypothetical protein